MARLAAFPEPMNVEQFLAFAAARPDGEKWELLNGKLFLNASPVHPHQIVVANLINHLGAALRDKGKLHRALPGIGVRISDLSAVEPDVMVRPYDQLRGNICDDIVAAFEVLSPSTRHNDLDFKRIGYANLPTLTHYVVVAPDHIEVRVFSRGADWAETTLTKLCDCISFDSLRICLTLAEIYDDMAEMLEPNNA